MNKRKVNEKKLINALENCWYLTKEEKKFWIENMADIPDRILLNVLVEIQKTNKTMNKCIQHAIKNDPENTYSKQLTSKINKIKAKAFEIEEETFKDNLDEDMEKQMENL